MLNITFFFKIIFTIFLLYFTLKNIEYSSLSNLLIKIDIKLIVLAIIIQFSLSIVQTLRWIKISNYLKLDLTFFKYWENILIGIFFNQTLPSSIGGDAIRILLLSNFGYKLPFKTIIIDRIFGLITLCFICSTGLFFVIDNVNKNHAIFESIYLSLLLLTIFIFFIILTGKSFLKLKIIEQLFLKIGISSFFLTMRDAFLNYKISLKVFFYSILIYIITSISGLLIIHSLQIDPNIFDFSIIFISVILFSTLPVSIGGWGIRENLMVFMMSCIGINNEIALSTSIIFGLIMLVVGIPGGLLWLNKKIVFKIKKINF